MCSASAVAIAATTIQDAGSQHDFFLRRASRWSDGGREPDYPTAGCLLTKATMCIEQRDHAPAFVVIGRAEALQSTAASQLASQSVGQPAKPSLCIDSTGGLSV